MLLHCQNKQHSGLFNKHASVVLIGVCCLCSAFTTAFDPYEWCQRFLVQSFNPTADNTRLKKWDININSSGFLRLRKHYLNGKQEYFSLNVKKLDAMDYLGTTAAGILVLKTAKEDIIVQTYNDPKGDVDSMSHSMKIAVENISAERLDTLQSVLFGLKGN